MIFSNIAITGIILIVVFFVVPPMVSAPNTVSVLTGITLLVFTVITAIFLVKRNLK